MPSDTVQVATALISLIGTITAGVVTYLLARLKTDAENRGVAQQLHTQNVAVKVEEIQEALARIEANRANLAQLCDVLEQHSNVLITHVEETAAKLTETADPTTIREALEHHGRLIIDNTRNTIARLLDIDVAEQKSKSR